MSNIYIQEPPTNGKVCLKTTVGDLDIELWSKECPKACRNFVQLCSEGYYNGTIFHRVVPGFIVQGGDPTGSGMGGECIYGEPFKDEFHSRLKFVRRGLVAMANGGPNDNGSQFFFTLDKAPDLQGKHTIFGKVVGNTLYNMLKLGECEVDKNERPLEPHKILKAEVLNNPFPDIVPRAQKSTKDKDAHKEKSKTGVKAEKNFNLLSFGDEAEEEEEVSKQFVVKAKSAHDVLEDEKLSAEPAVRKEELFNPDDHEDDEDESQKAKEKEEARRRVAEKLRKFGESKEGRGNVRNDYEEEEDLHEILASERGQEEKSTMDQLKMEFKQLQKEMAKAAKRDRKKDSDVSNRSPNDTEQTLTNPLFASVKGEFEKYKAEQEKVPARKTTDREKDTLAMLERFKQKMDAAKQLSPSDHIEHNEMTSQSAGHSGTDYYLDEEEDPYPTVDWLAHKFEVTEELRKDAKDANRKTEDSFDIYDPRNPMNKRRREKESKGSRRREWDEEKYSKRSRRD